MENRIPFFNVVGKRNTIELREMEIEIPFSRIVGKLDTKITFRIPFFNFPGRKIKMEVRILIEDVVNGKQKGKFESRFPVTPWENGINIDKIEQFTESPMIHVHVIADLRVFFELQTINRVNSE